MYSFMSRNRIRILNTLFQPANEKKKWGYIKQKKEREKVIKIAG
jgi:hypothetical protein